MIDFRYHIVSLVAVFLALAVGIILGAGPLQNSIGNILSNEVDALRGANTDLKSTNESLTVENENYVAAIDQIAPTLLNNTLTEQSIAIVAFPEVANSDIEKVKEMITHSGAVLSGVYEIQKAWTDAKNSAYRSSFAEQIKSYVKDAQDETDANKIMALALNQIVREGINSEDNKVLTELMTSAQTVMLSLIDGEHNASQAIIFLSPDMPDLTPEKDTVHEPDQIAQAEYDLKTFGALVNTVGEYSSAVLGGYANSQNDLVIFARTAGTSVSTVDTLNSSIGALNTVLAVAAELNAEKVAYGFADGTDAVVGKRVEIPVSPAPSEGN